SATPAAAFRRRTEGTSSSASTAPTRRVPGPAAAPAWAWPSARTSSTPTAGASTSRARATRAPLFPSCFPCVPGPLGMLAGGLRLLAAEGVVWVIGTTGRGVERRAQAVTDHQARRRHPLFVLQLSLLDCRHADLSPAAAASYANFRATAPLTDAGR